MIQLRRTFEEAMESGALRQLAARLDEGSRVVTVSGTAGGAKALTIAKAILAENRPAAVIAPSNAEAQNLAQELQFYFDLLSPNPIEITTCPLLKWIPIADCRRIRKFPRPAPRQSGSCCRTGPRSWSHPSRPRPFACTGRSVS